MSKKKFNQPLSGDAMPRSGGIATMMRLPTCESTRDVDACFIGVPSDSGASHRAGTRFGPRQIRAESTLLRPCNPATGSSPFDNMQVADLGDVPINPYNLPATIKIIETFYRQQVFNFHTIPLTMGGDHTLTLPILRAAKKELAQNLQQNSQQESPALALIHVDAHADVNQRMFGELYAHGTVFRRAVEEGLLDAQKVWQIGLRGSSYAEADWSWGEKQGFQIVPASDCWGKDLTALMEGIRNTMKDAPVYLSFDIDSLDPAFAPGTGTPEIAGLTSWQALQIIRGCRGLNLIGCDLVEVSPPYDQSGNTALTAANLLFEMLCVLPPARQNLTNAQPLSDPTRPDHK